jgi:hypothetical protein
MRITAIVDADGQLVAATTGPVGDPAAIAAGAGDEDGGGIELLEGQTARELEVADSAFDDADADELIRSVSDQLS